MPKVVIPGRRLALGVYQFPDRVWFDLFDGRIRSDMNWNLPKRFWDFLPDVLAGGNPRPLLDAVLESDELTGAIKGYRQALEAFVAELAAEGVAADG